MIVVGIGCRRGCPAARIGAAVGEALERVEMTPERIDALAAPAFKAEEAALSETATALGVPLRWIGRASLEAVQPLCPTKSSTAAEATGLAAVSEAAALAAAGRNARLLLPRIARDGVTCAVAHGDGA
ncbi:MAG: cobalamin biosynthesis protein [Rhodospirillaceae bacterium]|nr:cobalamin biosynthesis protein [Rhodospirillaceae bacterium]